MINFGTIFCFIELPFIHETHIFRARSHMRAIWISIDIDQINCMWMKALNCRLYNAFETQWIVGFAQWMFGLYCFCGERSTTFMHNSHLIVSYLALYERLIKIFQPLGWLFVLLMRWNFDFYLITTFIFGWYVVAKCTRRN